MQERFSHIQMAAKRAALEGLTLGMRQSHPEMRLSHPDDIVKDSAKVRRDEPETGKPGIVAKRSWCALYSKRPPRPRLIPGVEGCGA